MGVGIAGAALLGTAVQGLAGLDDRLATESAQPRPVKLESAPRPDRDRGCPFHHERETQPEPERPEV